MTQKLTSTGVQRRLFLFLSLLLPIAMLAVTKQNADREYRRGNYQQAIADYKELLIHGASAAVYYNLGNAYFRSDSLAQAILSYERAKQLDPGDDDIRTNLEIARSKTIDKIIPKSQNIFTLWYDDLVNFTGVDQWATLAVASTVVTLLLALVWLFAPGFRTRQLAFIGSIVFLLLFLCAHIFAWQQRRSLLQQDGIIVVQSSISVKTTPTLQGRDAFVLHEGTRLDVTDRSIKGWLGVRLADGREGWVVNKGVEQI